MKLSIIVPVYNSGCYLKKTLRMLADIYDKFPNKIEVILVNDGSTDNSLDIIKSFTLSNPKFQIISYGNNQGVSIARNIGIKASKGEYVTFFDSDDEIYISNLKSIFKLMNGVDIIYSDFEKDENITINNKNRYKIMQIIYRVQGKSAAGINSKFYRREFLIKNSLLFPEDVVFNEDSFFALKTLKYAKNLILTTNKFYIIKASHSLPFFNQKLLTSSNALARNLNNLFDESERNIEIKNIIDKVHIDIMIPLIDRYFGPLVEKKKITLNDAAQELKKLDKNIHFSDSCKNKKWISKFRFRYKTFCKLMRYKKYKTIIIFNNLMDKIKNYDRFKE